MNSGNCNWISVSSFHVVSSGNELDHWIKPATTAHLSFLISFLSSMSTRKTLTLPSSSLPSIMCNSFTWTYPHTWNTAPSLPLFMHGLWNLLFLLVIIHIIGLKITYRSPRLHHSCWPGHELVFSCQQHIVWLLLPFNLIKSYHQCHQL